jgi:uncharacterized protein involved in exopolysaccharide biosynthesis
MQETQENEIELIDIIRVLWKRRYLIILGTLLLTLGAAGISLVLPKVYEVSALIEPGIRPIADANGQIVNELPVITPEALKETILSGAYDGTIQNKLKITPGNYPDIKVSTPKNTTFIRIFIESADPERAMAILDELLLQANRDIQGKLENEKNKVENEIKLAEIDDLAIGEKIKLVEGQVANTAAKIQEMEKDRQKSITSRSTDAMSVLLYSNEIQNQQIYLNSLQETLQNLKTSSLSSVVRMDNLRLKLGLIKSTRVIKPPSVPEHPVKPKKVLIVALAGFLGLLGSMMLAFLLEYLERSGGVRPSGAS